MKQIITYEDLITASGSYPERLNSLELTIDIKENAKILLEKVNGLLNDLGIEKVKISSGFRPSSVNANIPNASKKSNHSKCLAIDIIDDKGQSLGKKLEEDYKKNKENSMLVKHDLYMESLLHTIGKNTNWVHLQAITVKSGNRIFIP